MQRKQAWRGRLHSDYFWVDAQLSLQDGRWLASVDTPRGPTTAWGATALSALANALEPFDSMAIRLLHSAPPDLIDLIGT